MNAEAIVMNAVSRIDNDDEDWHNYWKLPSASASAVLDIDERRGGHRSIDCFNVPSSCNGTSNVVLVALGGEPLYLGVVT